MTELAGPPRLRVVGRNDRHDRPFNVIVTGARPAAEVVLSLQATDVALAD